MHVNLGPHSLVGDKIPPDGVIELTGYLGPSLELNHVRLYFDLSFCSYCEIPHANGEVLMTVSGKDEGCPTKLYLKAKTEIAFVQVNRGSAVATFLEGKIVMDHMKGAERPEGSISRPIGMEQEHGPIQAMLGCTRMGCNTPAGQCTR